MIRKDFTKPDGRKLQLYSRRPISDDIVSTNPLHDDFIPNPQMRWHPLRGEWVIYAAHRQNRTFLPPPEYSPLAVTTSMDFPTELPAGDYDMAVFENLFPSLTPLATELSDESKASLSVPSQSGQGTCEVVVFTQDPKKSLGELSLDQIALALEVIGDRTKELSKRPNIQYVLPFENRGVEVGVTLHHPHGQIYSYPFIPPVPAQMIASQKKHFEKTGQTLMSEMVQAEQRDGRRLLEVTESVVSFVPVCARYAYETWIVPKRPVPWIFDLTSAEIKDMAIVLKNTLTKFDKMWNRPFPYLMTFYQAPTDGLPNADCHAHIQIYPAFRAKDKLKYLAGTELGAGIFVNDSFPEEKAAELRSVKV